MKQLRYRLNIVCVSYTTNILILLMLSLLKIEWSMGIDDRALFELFIMHIAISLSIYVIDLLVENGDIRNHIISIVSVLFLVLFLGGVVFEMFPLDVMSVVIISVMSVLIYAVTVWATFMIHRNDAARINKKIKEKNHD